MGSRLTRTPRFTSRGFASKGRVVRRFAMARPKARVLGFENRERQSALEGPKSPPKPLSDRPKWLRPSRAAVPPPSQILAADRRPSRGRDRRGARRAGGRAAPPENCRVAAVGKSA